MSPLGLGRLRRFARTLAGNTIDGDELIRRVVAPIEFMYDDDDTNDVLWPMFARLSSLVDDASEFRFGGPTGTSVLQEEAQDELGLIGTLERKVFALYHVEEFDLLEISEIIRVEHEAVREALETAEQTMFAQERHVLLFEPDADLAAVITEDLRHQISSLIVCHEERLAVAALDSNAFELIITEMNNEYGRRAVDVIDYVQRLDTSVIWITPSLAGIDGSIAERGNVFGKPFDLDELGREVRRSLYVEPHGWYPHERSFTFPNADEGDEDVGDDASEEALVPTLAPIDAEIADGRLTLATSEPPVAAVALDALDAVREQHLEEARWQADDFRTSNGSPRVQRHLDALVGLLQQQLTDQSVLRLTVGVDGMARQLATIEAEMMPLVASDMASFVTGLQQFINQFVVSRQFRAEAAAGRPISREDEEALRSIYQVIITQPSTVVDPALREQLVLLEQARAQHLGSPVGDVAHVSSLANITKAPARAIKAYGGDLLTEMRKLSIKTLSTLIVGLATASGLHHLSLAFPEQFAAVYVLLTRAKKQLDESGLIGDGGADD